MKKIWLDIVLNRPWFILFISVLFTFLAGYGSSQLYFRGDYKVFFEDDYPQRIEYEDMQRIFNKNENITIAIAPKEGDVFTPARLKLIQDLTEASWQTPYSSRVDSITNFQHTEADGDDLIVEDLFLEDVELTPQKIEQIRNIATTEPNLLGRLISGDGRVSIINITVNLPDDDKTEQVYEITEFVRNLTASVQQNNPDIQFFHSGIVLMNYSFAAEAQKDSQTLVPLMGLVILIMLLILLRSIGGTIATLIVIVVSIVSTMGISGWMGYFMSTATVNVPTIIMTLAVADCVHVIATMNFALRQGKSKRESILYSMQLNLMPIWITSITTAIGFMTLNFSDVPVIRDLGNLTALGVMIACILSMTMLPALLILMPIKTAKARQTNGTMEKFAQWVIRKHKPLLVVNIFIIALCSGFIVLNQVNDEATKYFAKTTEFRQAVDFLQENISGMSTVDFAMTTPVPGGINDPQFIKTLESFSSWLREQPEVDHVATLSDTFKRLNMNMHADNPDHYTIPQERELAAQYLLLYEMSLPYGLDLNNQLNIDKSSTKIVVTLKNLGSNEFIAFEYRAKQWFEKQKTSYMLTAASPSLMFAHVGQTNMQSMLKSLPLALILISGLLVFALKSLRMGLISLIPNIVPATIGFGVWGLISGEINLGLAVVAGMSLGIIVDDTVHFLSKYKHARDEEGLCAEEAVHYAFSSVGRALWITTLVLSSGFIVLAMSAFRLNSDMGLLTGMILVIALLIDFLFLPAFLIIFDNKKVATHAAI
ncbi:efflux RND transporter permease subunit [Algicola sagamiensis]|uniref:efflux RND transporter permease subunit n=1 Tax=Algicola sagamiensis TaxID=163869 RepID=UPI000369660E|nr:MMPL family transporter [Algicola sagamiensis]